MKLISIQIGQPKPIFLREKNWMTAIDKAPIPGPVNVHALGLEGDAQANRSVHGGEGRAVYGFSLAAYALWSDRVDSSKLKPGLFGENFTFDDIDESQIFVGDQFELGTTILQATMPRIPCLFLNANTGREDAGKFLHATGRPGVLFRVLREGAVANGDVLKPIKVRLTELTITDFFRMFENRGDILRSDFQILQNTPYLPENFLTTTESQGRIVD